MQKKRRRLGNYEIIKPLTSGTMARVFLARHLLTKEEVGLKLLELPNPLYEKRFIQEAKILKSINHPNVLRIFETGKQARKCLFYTMELKLKSLSERLDNPPFEKSRPKVKLTVDEKLLILYDVTKALVEIHKRNVIHRDINPKNILLNSKNEACLCDFGLSKFENEEIDKADKANPKGYGPPEQDESLSKANKSADIYSFGVTAYQVLCGKMPKGRNFPRLQDINSIIPTEIGNIIDRCLDNLSDNRPTATDLCIVFGKYLEYQNDYQSRGFEETAIPVQFKEILGSGVIDYKPFSVDEVSFCLKNCTDSYIYTGIACRALTIPELQDLLTSVREVKFVIVNPNNIDLVNSIARLFNKSFEAVKADVLTSKTILENLQSNCKNIQLRFSNYFPAWRTVILDNKYGFLRNYTGNRLPYQSPMLRVKTGAYLNGIIRYNYVLWDNALSSV